MKGLHELMQMCRYLCDRKSLMLYDSEYGTSFFLMKKRLEDIDHPKNSENRIDRSRRERGHFKKNGNEEDA